MMTHVGIFIQDRKVRAKNFYADDDKDYAYLNFDNFEVNFNVIVMAEISSVNMANHGDLHTQL